MEPSAFLTLGRYLRWSSWGVWTALLVGGLGCQRPERSPDKVGATGAASTTARHQNQHSPSQRTITSSPPDDEQKEAARLQPAPAAPASCPPGMNRVQGGTFWVGTRTETYEREENPYFSTRVASFCADVWEVSTQNYQECVEAGKCKPPSKQGKTCNTVDKGKGNHPINCIDYQGASQVCEFRGGRLPSEVEWEYLARGGAEMRKYPWGEAPPDGNTCWKRPGTCQRGQFTAGAFGLHDVVGNVWEWTSSWFGHYPWPEQEGRHRVFRGGSWSRRFDKWMRPNLRNRVVPTESGSHLGARCVQTLPDEACPYGQHQDRTCRFGVEEVHCLDGQRWNGVRCANPGDDRRCLPGATEEAGWGCVRPRVAGTVSHELDLSGVTRRRSPEFDADCQTNQPSRPRAYRIEGGEHLARNAVGKQLGCKNRDVGVGFNSACCAD